MNFWLKENNLKYQNFLFDFSYENISRMLKRAKQFCLSLLEKVRGKKKANNKFVKSAKCLVIDGYFVKNDGEVC